MADRGDDNDQPKPGYERIHLSCGGYHDRVILREGECRCDSCGCGFPAAALHEDGANERLRRVCQPCLDDGKVLRCRVCRAFVCKPLGFLARIDRIGFGDGTYCDACKPLLSFVVRNSALPGGAAEIVVPRDKAYSVPTDWLCDEAARLLGVPPDRVRFGGGMRRGLMMCPAEYTAQQRKFDVEIIA